MLEAPVKLMFCNHVLDGQELFLNFRQTEKVKLQMHQSKEQRKIRMGGRDKGTKQKQKKQNIVVHLVSNLFESYIAKCRQLSYFFRCQMLKAVVAYCVYFQ
jgi:hypothetical protein